MAALFINAKSEKNSSWIFLSFLFNHKSIEVWEIKNYSRSKDSQRRKKNRCCLWFIHVMLAVKKYYSKQLDLASRIVHDKQQLKLISLWPNLCSYYFYFYSLKTLYRTQCSHFIQQHDDILLLCGEAKKSSGKEKVHYGYKIALFISHEIGGWNTLQ